MRFRIGNAQKNIDNLTINWPNNSFQGICQNEQTALNTAQLNETIEACGWLLEPENGVLPAHSQVLVITSTDMCIESNSFSALSDTLYVIYQCPGNYNGHFANYGSGFRTTIISFGGGCTSSVSYNRALLVSPTGANVAADGATVDFPSGGGAPIYYNNGCNAPVPVQVVEAGADLEFCPGEAITLAGQLTGNFTEWYWTGGTGSFDNSNQLNAIYTPGVDETTVTITLNAINCNGVVTDEVTLTIAESELPEITPGGVLTICPGETLELTVSGNGDVEWNTGETSAQITVSAPGSYTATVTGNCGPIDVSVDVALSDAAALNVSPSTTVLICDGESATLTATGTGAFLWSTGSTESAIEVATPGEYTVQLTNDCGVFEETITVSQLESPAITLLSSAEILLCGNATALLEATGDGTFLWSTGETSASIEVNETGTYTVWLSNACHTDSASVLVADGGSLPEASIDIIGNSAICAGETVTLNAVTNTDFVWYSGDLAASIEVNSPGIYGIIATNECGSSEAEVIITQNTIPLVTVLSETATICHGEPVEIVALSNLPISWHPAGTGNTQTFTSPGQYYAHVSNNCGSDTAFFEITEGNPLASFIATPDTGTAPLEVNFLNTSVDASDYEWSINGSAAGSEFGLNTVFHQPGTYAVELIATDTVGCSSSFALNYTVNGCEEAVIFIPNTFTPNGDGINDRFEFVARCVVDYEMNIYNRYGVKIYSGRKGDPFWDADNGSGYYVSDGVYIYSFEYKQTNGINGRTSGTVTVFR